MHYNSEYIEYMMLEELVMVCLEVNYFWSFEIKPWYWIMSRGVSVPYKNFVLYIIVYHGLIIIIVFLEYLKLHFNPMFLSMTSL
jgi:hypothetical protein